MEEQVVPLTDLTGFKPAGNSWQIVGDVTADLNKENKLNSVKGTGILLNQPGKNKVGVDLTSTFEHGDIDLELILCWLKNLILGFICKGNMKCNWKVAWG